MKTFNQLTVGDVFYHVYSTEMEYRKEAVTKVDNSDIHYGYSTGKIPRFKDNNGVTQEYSRYGDGTKRFYFVNEADAIRFCKARMMKTLFGKINSAKAAINEVKKFREKHYELLNHQWTQAQINILEKELS